MPYIPPPYEERSPDGRQYFKILGVPPALLRMYELLLTAAELAGSSPDPRIKAQGPKIDLLILKVKRQVEENARATALQADAMIRSRIESTRVRPVSTAAEASSSSGITSGIRSRPVPSVLPGGGAVGIADIQELIHATLAPSANSRVPYYWRAIEFGSTHNVGRRIFGVFQPGEAAPNPAEFRTHPIFETRGRGQGKRKEMLIGKPIQAKGFLRDGAYDAYLFRKRLNRGTESKAIAEMRRLGQPSARGARRRS